MLCFREELQNDGILVKETGKSGKPEQREKDDLKNHRI